MPSRLLRGELGQKIALPPAKLRKHIDSKIITTKLGNEAGIKSAPIQGDAEPALKRGDGDANAMGLGLIHDPHNAANSENGNPFLIGQLPAALDMHMDMAAGISVHSADVKNAAAFIAFATSPPMRLVWKSKGIERY